MGVGRKFSKHPIQTLCVTAEETEAQREEGRFLALSTLSVKSQIWNSGYQVSFHLAPPTNSFHPLASHTGLRENK